MGDRLATIDMGRKLGGVPFEVGAGCVPFWDGAELGPHLTQCGLGRGLPSYQVASWSIQTWPQYTNVTDRTGQTVLRSDSIERTVFTARRYASAVLGVVILSVRLSVCLSVCHTRALWLIQRTYRRYFYTTRKGNPYSFLTPKISSKFQRVHPQLGRQREVG